MANKLTVKAEPGKHDAILTREFDAPREKVFETMFSAKGIPQWWGQGTRVEKFDAKPGGSWSVAMKAPNGYDARMHGIFHDVKAPERVVRTFEAFPGNVILETTTFEDLGGRTKMTLQNLCQSVEARDQLIKYGMEKGAAMTYDKLEEVLAGELEPA